jgi:hypothetical protein
MTYNFSQKSKLTNFEQIFLEENIKNYNIK